MNDFQLILFGSEVNAYSMARSFYEEYKLKPIVIGNQIIPQTNWSNILELRIVPGIYEKNIFLKTIGDLANEFQQKNIKGVVLGCHDIYIRLIAENKNEIEKYFVLAQIDETLLNQILLKENLYNLCDKYGIDHPKTKIMNKNENVDMIGDELKFPVVIKPSDTVQYSQLKFEGKKKVYIVQDKEKLQDALNLIRTNGYNAKLIIQEFIQADDPDNYTFAAYLDKNSKTKMAIFTSHTVLEYVPTAFGMPSVATVIEPDSAIDKLMTKYIKLLEDIKYIGHTNFDIIYDSRDNKYKVLEINARQGKTIYLVTAAGLNAMKLIVDDYIFNKELIFKKITNKTTWSLLSKDLMFRLVDRKEIRKYLHEIIQMGNFINPLECEYEKSIIRKIYINLSKLIYYLKYIKYYKKTMF